MKKYLLILALLSLTHCSTYEDDIYPKTSSENGVNDELLTSALYYVEKNSNQIFDNSYPSPLNFDYSYRWSQLDQVSYLTLYITPLLTRETSSLAQLAQQGYTNVIFELNSSGDAFSSVHLIKVYPDLEYLTRMATQQESPPFEIRPLVKVDNIEGRLHFIKNHDYFHSSDKKSFSNEMEDTLMEEIVIIIGPKGPVGGGGGGGHPPRPTWGHKANYAPTPPGGGGNSSGSGTHLSNQQPSPREQKIQAAKNPTKIPPKSYSIRI